MAQGPNNNDAFLGSAMQFMQAGQNITQQFMEFMGKSGSQESATPPPAADPQALNALQKSFMDQQMSLWQAMLAKQQGQEQNFKVAPEPGDRRFSAPEWRESPIYDYTHQAYLLNTKFLKEMVELMPSADDKEKNRLRFMARQVADAMAPSNFAATNPEFIKLALETKVKVSLTASIIWSRILRRAGFR
jgi:polyhydroxyalkanoate synthase